MLALVSLATPWLTPLFQAQSTPVRILAALAVLLPAGFFMGMAFPIGMKRAAESNAALTPWLWGVNGATSVCASVLAVVIAMAWGINAASWIGVACYALAFWAFMLTRQTASLRQTPQILSLPQYDSRSAAHRQGHRRVQKKLPTG